jgi:GT2 family glycosyltransferase
MAMQYVAANNKPLISVCIANYNGIHIVGPCIESVINQKTDYPIEILVHDDASTDESVDYIKRNYPQVTLLLSEHNIGYCLSNNKLARHAKGKYFLFLNNDATLFTDAIQTLAEFSERTDDTHILGLPQYNMHDKELLDRGHLFDIFLNPVANKDSNRKNVGMIMGACLWVPELLWNKLGGFPAWFESIAEDMYLCMYAFISGHDVVALNSSGYFHKVGHSFGGGKIKNNRLVTTAARRRLSERNKCYVMILFYPAIFLYLVLPVHLLFLLLEGLTLALVKRNLKIFTYIYVNTLKYLWTQKTLLCEKRRSVQSSRTISHRKFLSVFIYYPYKLKMLLFHGLPSLK